MSMVDPIATGAALVPRASLTDALHPGPSMPSSASPNGLGARPEVERDK